MMYDHSKDCLNLLLISFVKNNISNCTTFLTDKTNYSDQQRKLFYNSPEVFNWSRSVGGLQGTFELIIVTTRVSPHCVLFSSLYYENVENPGPTMERYNGMKRSSSESATNATREPETMFSNVAPESVQPKPWKQRFSFRQPRKQQPIEEVCSQSESPSESEYELSECYHQSQYPLASTNLQDEISSHQKSPIIGRYGAVFTTNH